MGGGTGRLPEREVFYPWFQNFLYGRRDGMFAGPDAPSKLPPPGHLVLGPDAPLQDQMPPFITQVCQAVLKRTYKLLKCLCNEIFKLEIITSK